MKTVFIALLLLGSMAKAEDNIVSLVFGDGPSGVLSTSTPASTQPGGPHNNGKGEDDNKNLPNHSDVINPGSVNPRQDRGLVVGLQYQRRIDQSPLWMGVLAQSNKTYSITMGVGF